MGLGEYERQRVADFLEENWSAFVESLTAHYDSDEAESIAEEIVTALKGE
jgi:hypothetical protein